jgi:hypothetical protein
LDSSNGSPHSKSFWEDSLRAKVSEEATDLLNDPDIKHPIEHSNSFANTLWLGISADDNTAADDEAGKASLSAWVNLAAEELSKVAFKDVGDMVKSETKKALAVIADRHHQYLREKLEGCYEVVKARLEN